MWKSHKLSVAETDTSEHEETCKNEFHAEMIDKANQLEEALITDGPAKC